MKVVVTGAAGRIGSDVCRVLKEQGLDVFASDQKYNNELGLPFKVMSLLDACACYELLEGADVVVHLGNIPNMTRGLSAQTVFNDNTVSNMNVFQAAQELKVKKIVFASSIQVISGERKTDYRIPYLPLDADLPQHPGNTYALSKASSEMMLEHYAREYGMQCIAVRFPAVYCREWIDYSKQCSEVPEKSYDFIMWNQALTAIFLEDASSLVGSIVATDLPGYRVYQPGSKAPWLNISSREIYERYFSDIPLKCDIEDLDCLCDNSHITRDTGWSPSSLDMSIPPTEESAE